MVHAQYPRVIYSPADLPPVPPELVELQQQRDATIAKEVSDLKAALGEKAAAKLDSFLEHEFAPTVTVQTVGPPRPHDPVRSHIPAFAKEPQQ